MSVSYRELLERIKELDDEHLDDDATIYDSAYNEFVPVHKIETQHGDDVLDDGHLFLTV